MNVRQLNCFVIIPSNRGQGPANPEQNAVKLVHDDKWGLVELPTGCEDPSAAEVELNFDEVYAQIIVPAIEEVNRKYKNEGIEIVCTRGQDIKKEGIIIQQIVEHTCKADITITDITTLNPNVFLEYGIRLAVRDSGNIMISHSKIELPFDVKSLRTISYAMDVRSANYARDEIAEFIVTYIKELNSNKESRGEIDFYKRFVDLYTGRGLERNLSRTFEAAPKLIAELAGYFFTRKANLHLKRDLFNFLKAVENVLRSDPQSSRRAIEYLKLISSIRGLSREKLQETYYTLSDLCDADDNLKEESEYYLDKAMKLEDQ